MTIEEIEQEQARLRAQRREIGDKLKALEHARNKKLLEAEVAAMDPAKRERLRSVLAAGK